MTAHSNPNRFLLILDRMSRIDWEYFSTQDVPPSMRIDHTSTGSVKKAPFWTLPATSFHVTPSFLWTTEERFIIVLHDAHNDCRGLGASFVSATDWSMPSISSPMCL